MKKLFTVLGAGFFCAALFLVSSCSSLQQDVVISSEQLIHQEDILAIETRLAKLDADYIMNENAKTRSSECAELLKLIDEAFESSLTQRPVQARLYALQGRVFLLMGRKSDARTCYNDSLKFSRGDAQATVLAFRFGLIDSIEDKTLLAQSNQKALLVLESGLSCYLNGDYINAVAKMDEAFISLDGFYRESYNSVRASAWSLRGVSSSSSLVLLKSVSTSDIALITQESTTLLSFYTGSKELSRTVLYKTLCDAGMFLPRSAQNAADYVNPAATDKATRALCARFLWNLYTSRRNNARGATMYSSAYRTASLSSPVPDVPVDSPDFDAILGCVENEIIDLVDGVNFMPQKEVSGAEFNAWVSKIK